MKMKLSNRLVVVLCSILLAACSGGGGSGGGSGSSKRPSTGFRVLHGAIDTAPLDIYSSLKEGSSLGVSAFERSSNYISSGTGDLTVTLTRSTLSSDVVFSQALSLGKGDVFSILVYGDRKALGERIALIPDPGVAVTSGNSAIRFIHAAGGAASIAASAADTLAASDLAFGAASDYLEVPSGDQVIRVRRVSDGGLILNPTLSLQSGKSYSYLVKGEIGTIVTGELLAD